MKRLLTGSLLLVFLLVLMPLTAFAGADTYPYLTFEDSSDFTIVNPVISYEVIRAMGLDDVNWEKHEISDPQNISWSSTNSSVATVVPVDGQYAVLLFFNEGEATVTASYTCADNTVITCPANVVVERRNNPVNQVQGVHVTVTGDVYGSGIDIDLTNLTVPKYSLKDVFGSSFDEDDVLTMDPTALHALLYALELEEDDDNYVWGDAGWDWDWAPSHVTITTEGAYVQEIDGDVSGWPTGWKYKVGGVELDKAASIAKLTNNGVVNWAFTDDWQ